MDGLMWSLSYGAFMALADSVSVVLVIFLMEATLTRKYSLSKTIGTWAIYLALFYLIDGAGYTIVEQLGIPLLGDLILGDLICFETMAFLLMIPASKLYKEHYTSNIFILELTILIGIISTFTTGVIATSVLSSVGVDFGLLWLLLYGAMKIPVVTLAYFIYKTFILNITRQVVDILDGKMGRYIPVAIIAITFVYAYGAITGYMPDMGIKFVMFYTVVCTTFGIMYWLIFSGAVWTSRALKTETELNVASGIQKDMLPSIFPAFPERPEFEIYASMQPAKEVGGDFYDFFLIDNDHLAVVMADVSGKGVPAALFMVIAKTIIKNHAQSGLSAEKVLERANNQLCENNQAGMFVTVFIGILEISTGKFIFANAGHNAPLIMKNGKAFEWLDQRPGLVLAGMEDMIYKKYETTLAKGDMLFLYTDGVTEALNKKEELYSDPRLIATVNALDYKNRSLEGLLKDIKADIDLFANGAEQADDITMLLLKIE